MKVAAGCEPPKGYAGGRRATATTATRGESRRPEVCNGYDDDCDELVDAPTARSTASSTTRTETTTGSGTPTRPPVVACSEPFGHEPGRHRLRRRRRRGEPRAIEVCNGRDDNCVVDEDDAIDRTLWYRSRRGRRHVRGARPDRARRRKGYVRPCGDCDDTDVATIPAPTKCDGISSTTTATARRAVTTTCDGDGYAGCDDCNDADPAINPGASEICDARRRRRGTATALRRRRRVHERHSKTAWYPDDDGDHYGDASASP
jgi:hypothetical protein